MNYVISRVQDEEELDVFFYLAEEIFPNLEINFSDDDLVYLAYLEGEPVGFVHIGEENEFFEVKGFGVKPDFRGKGVGKSLLEYGLEELYGKPVYLKTESSNPVMNLYSRFGFFAQNFGGVSILVKKELS